MCRACSGDFPSMTDYQELKRQATALWGRWSGHRNLAFNPKFIRDVEFVDNFRFSIGAGWGNPGHSGQPQRLIFENPDPQKGLLLYLLCNFLDAQIRTERVWNQLLNEADEWLSGIRKEPPRHNFENVRPHLYQIRTAAQRSGSAAGWFADSIVNIVSESPNGSGNLYRATGRFFQEMLKPADRKLNKSQFILLSRGECSLLGRWKRLWVTMRSLRRDNSIVKCLFERALKTHVNGPQALNDWFSEFSFSSTECQLPVDVRVKKGWNEIMNSNLNLKGVASQAQEVAVRNNVSPSIFDVLFISRN